MVRLREYAPRTLGSEKVRQFQWDTDSGMSVSVISYGAAVYSIHIPDKKGIVADVCLGYDDIESYAKINTPTLLGAPVGRVINRIRDARFQLDGQTYHVAQNFGRHFLHGGYEGFNKKNWNVEIDGNRVVFSYLSKDGEEGFPGDLITTIIYEVTEDMILHQEFIATTSKKTIVNLGNHAYFNLGGHDAGAEALYEHIALINSDKITDGDEDFVPNGEFIAVGGTPFDLRTPKRLGDLIRNAGPIFHHNFCVTNYNEKTLNFVARMNHPPSGRSLEVYSNQPGLQFYTGYYLPHPPELPLPGRGGTGYRRHAGFCLETQNYPDAINHPNFPSPILKPGEVYKHRVQYRFGVDK
ncbi:galactose mutarotase-like [Cydia strobilella]|uniref:galactose mutarotase-like n=1 Tax=Cydia strobilella TaxID=1100964 RepID=UPI0030040EE1